MCTTLYWRLNKKGSDASESSSLLRRRANMHLTIHILRHITRNGANAQNAENKPIKSPTFSVEALQEDFSQWRNRVEKKHPLIYFYHSKKEIDATFDSSYASIQTPMTEIDFFRLLSFVATKINDGHNFINPTNECGVQYPPNINPICG